MTSARSYRWMCGSSGPEYQTRSRSSDPCAPPAATASHTRAPDWTPTTWDDLVRAGQPPAKETGDEGEPHIDGHEAWLPRLAGAGLHIRLQAAQEVLPSLGDHLRRRVLPSAVIEGDHDPVVRVFEAPRERCPDPARHVVGNAGPANRFVRLHLVDAKAHVH